MVLLAAYVLVGLPSPQSLNERKVAPSTMILDRRGNLLYEVINPQSGKNTPIPLAEIPRACQNAVVATEDSHFYQHPGFDLWAIARAAWLNLREGRVVSGGSTITQQVVRNQLLPPVERQERSVRRKLREIWLAWRLTASYTKDEILTIYLNQNYYGHFAYGIEAAAQAYFGKSAAEMDLAECALLMGLLQSPATYNPLEHPEAAAHRQQVVLDLMAGDGYITPAEATLAAAEPLRFAPSPFPIEAPHFVMYVQGMLEQEIGLDRLQEGGLRVYTTLDLDMQRLAESILRRRLRQLQDDPNKPADLRVDTAALVALDPQTGEILAMVGSPDYFDGRINGAVNGALALRQPGSAIKPITYATAFDAGQAQRAGRTVYTPATMVTDVRTLFPTREGEPYIPLNYDLDYRGPVLLRQALASSLNIPAVKVLQHIGIDALAAQGTRMGITTMNMSDRFGLALTLGGGEVRLLELAAAYGAFASEGRRVDPIAIARVEDADGTLVLAGTPRTGALVIPPQVAFLISDILSDPEARMLTFGGNSILNLSRPAAVKTGTTTDWRDNWTVGYTPELVTGVWVGNPDSAPMVGVTGISGAAPIWHDFMELSLRGYPVQPFARPQGIVEVEICADSGLLPTDLCPRRRSEWFIEGTQPTRQDDMYQRIALDQRDGQRARPDTSPQDVVYRTYWVLPADLQEWAAQRGIAQPPAAGDQSEMASLAAANGGSSVRAEPPLVMLNPDPEQVYRINRSLPPDLQRIEVAARPGNGYRAAAITLLVDGHAIAEGSGNVVRGWWQLAPGRHVAQATGRGEDGAEMRSAVVEVYVEE